MIPISKDTEGLSVTITEKTAKRIIGDRDADRLDNVKNGLVYEVDGAEVTWYNNGRVTVTGPEANVFALVN